LSLYGSVLLFAEEEQPYSEWEIEDYKEAVIASDKYGKYIIYGFEEFAAYETGEKYFLCRGHSESVKYESKEISLYAFNKDHEFTEYNLGYSRDEYSEAVDIIMRGIPGNHLWNSVISIGDFNNDGLDEIASVHFGGAYRTFVIRGIDPDSKEVIEFLAAEFWVDWPPTYCPIEFVRYKGMDGFRVIKSDGMINSYAANPIKLKYLVDHLTWFFYTWDEKSRKYVEVEEVNPQYLGDTSTEEEENPQPVIDTENKTETVTETDAEKSPMPLWVRIAIIGGVAAVAVLTALFAVKRRK
jgi:hypothetical protein